MQQIPLSDLPVIPGRLVEWLPTLPKHRSEAHRRATFNQQKHFAAALLAREEKAPGTNWIGVTFTIPGQLDEEALEKAFNVFVHRHEVLQCTFEPHEDGLRCHRIQDSDLVLERSQLGWFASCDTLLQYLEGRFNAAFSPLSWPLIRMGAVIAEPQTTVYVVCDHIVGDGMSLVIAVNEVQTVYAALTRGEPVVLPEVGSYLDFGALQRERYAGIDARSPELDFWRRFMAGQHGRLFPRLPLEFGVKDGEADYPSANETIQLLDDEQATRLEALSRQYEGKFFMSLLAAVAIALREMSGIQEYRGLMPIAERKDPRWASAFGWFVNMIPIQFAVTGESFADVLAAAKTGFAESIAHVDVPLVKAWEHLEPDTYRRRSLPYPMNFFSFIDFRKVPGAEHYRVWSPNTIVHLSHSNSGNIWLYRNDDGTFLHALFAQTALSRRSMDVYRKTIRRVLCNLIEEPDRMAMNLTCSKHK